jgi:hypothetical protein
VAGGDAPFALEVTFVAGDDLDGHGFDEFEFFGAEASAVALEQAGVLLDAVLRLDVDHLSVVVQRVKGGRVGQVVDEEEGVGAQVGASPEGAIFFLAGGVGEGEVVGAPVDAAGYRIGVFDCGVVSGE